MSRVLPSRSTAPLLVALSLGLACGHAQPAVGPNKDPSVPVDPFYPEQNCQVNFTIDCRPGGEGGGLGAVRGPHRARG